MDFKIGQRFKNNLTLSTYEVYDITGQGTAVPSETPVIYLKLIYRAGYFNISQQLMVITGRKLLDLFSPVLSK